MRRLRPFWTLIVAGVLLSACENSTNRGLQTMRLPSCSKEGSIFETMDFEEWEDEYHRQIDAVIEAHLKAMRNMGKEPLKCTEEDYAARVTASDALREMAEKIPAWKDRTGDLAESDMQAVLLEFLRIYECSMDEDSLFLPLILTKGASMERGEFNEQMAEIRALIAREKVLARESLGRTLGLVSGFDRLQPFALDIECLKRSSLDLRNVLGLASDVSSCLPRIWDAKGSLRDLEDPKK